MKLLLCEEEDGRYLYFLHKAAAHRFVATATESFSFTMEVNNKWKGCHAIEVVSSTTPWHVLLERIAELLNLYPTSLHLQYQLSTDSNKSYPLELTSQQNLDTLIALLWPLVVQPILASGRHSTRKMKSVTVLVFNKDDDVNMQSDGKVSEAGPYKLMLMDSDRKLQRLQSC